MSNFLPHYAAKVLVEECFQHFADWQMRSSTTFRNAVLGDGFFLINPLLVMSDKEQAVQVAQEALKLTVSSGRLLSFGFIPNQVLKDTSIKCHKAYEAGELLHPFDSWVGTTSWEGGFNAYHISPNRDDPSRVVIMEFYGISVPDVGDVVLLYDAVAVHMDQGKTVLTLSPMVDPFMETEAESTKRGSNSLDPMVTMLRLLSDASVPVIHHPAPDALNKHRAKKGKFTLPGHHEVCTKDYVTAWTTHSIAVRNGKGGSHASPAAHWRRAHKRHLQDGRVVNVRNSKVNWRTEEELHRMFYKL